MALIPVILIVILSACTTFKGGIEQSKLDQPYTMLKMQVDQPAPQQSLYVVQALFVDLGDANNPKPAVQGVKVRWTYQGGDLVTTFPLNKVKWVPDQSMEAPQFKVDWDKAYMEEFGGWSTYEDLFQQGGQFNPNDVLENQEYYSQVVIRLNQTDYDLVMSYIFK